jgi:hypothetical protein
MAMTHGPWPVAYVPGHGPPAIAIWAMGHGPWARGGGGGEWWVELWWPKGSRVPQERSRVPKHPMGSTTPNISGAALGSPSHVIPVHVNPWGVWGMVQGWGWGWAWGMGNGDGGWGPKLTKLVPEPLFFITIGVSGLWW